jgi:hypothetical protein
LRRRERGEICMRPGVAPDLVSSGVCILDVADAVGAVNAVPVVSVEEEGRFCPSRGKFV